MVQAVCSISVQQLMHALYWMFGRAVVDALQQDYHIAVRVLHVDKLVRTCCHAMGLKPASAKLYMKILHVCCRFGHTHWYTRSCPVYKRQCIPAAADGSQRAPVHLNIGNAGASFSWDVVDPALLTQDIYAAFAMQHGYMRVNATRTTLHIQVHPSAFCAALKM